MPVRRIRRYRKRVFPKRRVVVRKKAYKPRRVYKRSFKARSNQAVTVARQVKLQQPISMNDGAFGALTFTLETLLSADELTAWKELYDQYKIKGVQIRFVPKFSELSLVSTVGTATGNAKAVIPEIATVIDIDDADTVTYEEMIEYGTFRRQRFNREHKRYVIPRAATMVYNGATSTAYGPMSRRQWLDMANDDVPHYALKYIVTPSSFNTDTIGEAIYYDLYVTAYLAFKNKV